jgi:hypothetical protein
VLKDLDLSVEIITRYPIFVYKRRGRWHGVCREIGVHATAKSMREASSRAAFISATLQEILIERHCLGTFWPSEFSMKWATMMRLGVDLDLFDAIL